jgi:hypothetical protein
VGGLDSPLSDGWLTELIAGSVRDALASLIDAWRQGNLEAARDDFLRGPIGVQAIHENEEAVVVRGSVRVQRWSHESDTASMGDSVSEVDTTGALAYLTEHLFPPPGPKSRLKLKIIGIDHAGSMVRTRLRFESYGLVNDESRSGVGTLDVEWCWGGGHHGKNRGIAHRRGPVRDRARRKRPLVL